MDYPCFQGKYIPEPGPDYKQLALWTILVSKVNLYQEPGPDYEQLALWTIFVSKIKIFQEPEPDYVAPTHGAISCNCLILPRVSDLHLSAGIYRTEVKW